MEPVPVPAKKDFCFLASVGTWMAPNISASEPATPAEAPKEAPAPAALPSEKVDWQEDDVETVYGDDEDGLEATVDPAKHLVEQALMLCLGEHPLGDRTADFKDVQSVCNEEDPISNICLGDHDASEAVTGATKNVLEQVAFSNTPIFYRKAAAAAAAPQLLKLVEEKKAVLAAEEERQDLDSLPPALGQLLRDLEKAEALSAAGVQEAGLHVQTCHSSNRDRFVAVHEKEMQVSLALADIRRGLSEKDNLESLAHTFSKVCFQLSLVGLERRSLRGQVTCSTPCLTKKAAVPMPPQPVTTAVASPKLVKELERPIAGLLPQLHKASASHWTCADSLALRGGGV